MGNIKKSMKRLLTILIILTFFSCSNNNTISIENDPIITDVFDAEEINELRTLLNLFDDSLKNLMKIDNTIEAYYTFTDSLNSLHYSETKEEHYQTIQLLKPTVFKAIELFENGKLFNQSLFINYGSRHQDTISYFWEPIYNGKYIDFLNKLSERDNRFILYKNGIEQTGSIGPTSTEAFSLTKRQIDFGIERYRIAFIFHYLILLSEKDYK